MVALNWTEEAQNWLKEIHEYISEDSPKVAEHVILGIYERAVILKMFPKSGYFYKDDDNREIRILLYGHYKIVYLIKSPEVIDVLGVFHGHLDLKRFF